MSRPTKYTDELGSQICELLISGLSLVKVCERDGMPDRVTVHRWLNKHEDFATEYARARDSQADYMDDLILDVARASTSETAAADRVKILAYQWRASKLLPKKYGDRVNVNVSGESDADLIAEAVGIVRARTGGVAGDSETGA